MSTRTSRRRRIGWMGLIAVATLAGTPSAFSQGAKPAQAARSKKGPTVNVAALTEKLKSADPGELESGLNEAKSAGKGAAPVAPVIEELLRRGAPAELTSLALEALGAIGSETSSSAIAPYGRHRKADIRKKALTALSRTGGGLAAATLRAALSDPDPGVRGAAASGLGALKNHEVVPDLFSALDHGVLEAASSIGQLCAPDECEKLAGKLSTLGLDDMTTAFDSILFRPAAEMPDDEKIRIVERVRDLRTEGANKYLRDVQSRWPARESPRVKQALEQAVAATAGAKS